MAHLAITSLSVTLMGIAGPQLSTEKAQPLSSLIVTEEQIRAKQEPRSYALLPGFAFKSIVEFTNTPHLILLVCQEFRSRIRAFPSNSRHPSPCPTLTYRSLSVLIIGAGPAGLATAIEAAEQGCSVTVVEKRGSYSRPQRLFLDVSSVKLLKKWGVTVPMKTLLLDNLLQVVPINILENGLSKRAQSLGVTKIYGKFEAFGHNRNAIISITKDDSLIIPYDILVGADGLHSKIRQLLNIDKRCYKTAKGIAAIVDLPQSPANSPHGKVSPLTHVEGGVMRMIEMPFGSMLFAQFDDSFSSIAMENILKQQDLYTKFSKTVGNQPLEIYSGITIQLQQADSFSASERSAILIGEAAASASFFQGMGANTALNTSQAARQFFKEIQNSNPDAFENYNQIVKYITDNLIEDSFYLWDALKNSKTSTFTNR